MIYQGSPRLVLIWITDHSPKNIEITLAAGLFFRSRPRAHTRMDPDLENVIRQALDDALAVGRDHMSQTMLAVQAVQQARPDMTAADAIAAVNLVRQS